MRGKAMREAAAAAEAAEARLAAFRREALPLFLKAVEQEEEEEEVEGEEVGEEEGRAGACRRVVRAVQEAQRFLREAVRPLRKEVYGAQGEGLEEGVCLVFEPWKVVLAKMFGDVGRAGQGEGAQRWTRGLPVFFTCLFRAWTRERRGDRGGEDGDDNDRDAGIDDSANDSGDGDDLDHDGDEDEEDNDEEEGDDEDEDEEIVDGLQAVQEFGCFAMVAALRELEWLPHCWPHLMGAVQKEMERQIAQWEGNYEEGVLPQLLQWLERTVVPFMEALLVPKPQELEGRTWRADLRMQLLSTFCQCRFPELFSMVAEFPDSRPAVSELASAVAETDMTAALAKSLRAALEKRLLHPGATTAQIIDAYVSLVFVLRIVDPTDLLLGWVGEPVRRYLKSRDDAVRCIVQALAVKRRADGNESDTSIASIERTERIEEAASAMAAAAGAGGVENPYLRQELHGAPSGARGSTAAAGGGGGGSSAGANKRVRPLIIDDNLDSDDEDEEPGANWQPPLKDKGFVAGITATGAAAAGAAGGGEAGAAAGTSRGGHASANRPGGHGSIGRGRDVLSLLISVFGSKDLFVSEYRSMLAERLLEATDFDTDWEVQLLELFKARFGDDSLQTCEIMVRDVEESRRVNRAVHSALGADPSASTTPGDFARLRANDLSVTVVSDQYWPELNNEGLPLHPTVQGVVDAFGSKYRQLRNPRFLRWNAQLGKVVFDVFFDNGVQRTFSVNPAQASVLLFLQECNGGTSTLEDLTNHVRTATRRKKQQGGAGPRDIASENEDPDSEGLDSRVTPTAIRVALQYWIQKGVVRQRRLRSGTRSPSSSSSSSSAAASAASAASASVESRIVFRIIEDQELPRAQTPRSAPRSGRRAGGSAGAAATAARASGRAMGRYMGSATAHVHPSARARRKAASSSAPDRRHGAEVESPTGLVLAASVSSAERGRSESSGGFEVSGEDFDASGFSADSSFDVDAVDGGGGAIHAGAQRLKRREKLESLVVGVLRSVAGLSVERLHNMLKVFTDVGDGSSALPEDRYDMNMVELRAFLDELVDAQKLECVEGGYGLRRSAGTGTGAGGANGGSGSNGRGGVGIV